MNIRPEDYHPQGSTRSRPPYQRQISDNGDLMVRMESNRSLYNNNNDEQQQLLEDDDILADLKSLTVQPNKGGGGGATTISNTTTTTTKETSLEDDDDNNFLKKILGDVDDDLFDDDNKEVVPLPSSLRAQPGASIDDDGFIGNISMVMPTPVVVAPSIDYGFQTPVSTNNNNNKRRKFNNNPYYDLEPPTTPEINTEQKMMSLDMRYRILSNIDILSAPSCLTTMGMESSSPTPSELQSPSPTQPPQRRRRMVPMVTRKQNFNIALHKMMSTRNPSLLKLRKEEEEREYNNQ